MAATPAEAVDGFLNALKTNDFELMRTVLADDVEFVGPIDRLNSADAVVEASKGMSQMIDDLVIHKVWVDGADVLVWFDMHTKIAEPASAADWYHVQEGKITSIHSVFDARPFMPSSD